jgi:hypothetical protein
MHNKILEHYVNLLEDTKFRTSGNVSSKTITIICKIISTFGFQLQAHSFLYSPSEVAQEMYFSRPSFRGFTHPSSEPLRVSSRRKFIKPQLIYPCQCS